MPEAIKNPLDKSIKAHDNGSIEFVLVPKHTLIELLKTIKGFERRIQEAIFKP